MLNNGLQRSLLASGIGMALALPYAADAAVVRGSFDPVNFSGTFELSFNSSCLASDGWYTAAACNTVLTSASANVLSSPPEGPSYNGVLQFGPTYPPDVLGMYVYGGKLDSFDTTWIPYNPPGAPPTSDSWWIQFSSGQAHGGNSGPPTPDCDPYCFDLPPPYEFCSDFSTFAFAAPLVAGDLSRGVYLYAGNDNTGGEPDGPIHKAQYLNETFVTVPEPGMLWLLSGALTAACLVRRRRPSSGS